MTQKRVSSFATVYIIGCMIYILFLFYYIGTEMQRVQNSNSIILEKREELTLLEDRRNTRAKTKQIMLTPEYQDRIAKEIEGKLNDGEKEYVVPHSQKTEVSPLSEPNAPLYWQRPIVEEWKDVFFHPQS